jgi:hypothetical protein
MPTPSPAAEKAYGTVVKKLCLKKSVEVSQMLGMPSLKVHGKAFAGLFGDAMVFKLTGTSHSAALALKGTELFDPSGLNRPMKEWVQVPLRHARRWQSLADQGMKYVAKL